MLHHPCAFSILKTLEVTSQIWIPPSEDLETPRDSSGESEAEHNVAFQLNEGRHHFDTSGHIPYTNGLVIRAGDDATSMWLYLYGLQTG